MRKVTQEIAAAFAAQRPLSRGNTRTDGTTVYLHGNAIVRRDSDGIKFSLAGWPTVTTQERINGVLAAVGSDTRLVQKSYAQCVRTGSYSDDIDLSSLEPCDPVRDIMGRREPAWYKA